LNVRKLVLVLVLAVAGYYAVFGGEYTLVDFYRIHGERAEAEANVLEERAELERLRARADSLEHDPRTLERLARERFGLIREGEILYRFAEPPEEASPETSEGESERVDTAPPRR